MVGRFGVRLGQVLVSCVVVSLWVAGAQGTAFDDYVKANDPSYTWSHHSTITGSGYTADILDLKSQTWRAVNEVDRTLWQHWVHVIKPDTVTSSTAMLWIGSGQNSATPGGLDGDLVDMALATGTVVVDLSQIPNQRLKFADESDPRYMANGRLEDELIAYTWDKYLRGEDDYWPARLPMVKSAVRAMDMAQEYLVSSAGGNITIDDFVVAGASKRGWTTWMTAAMDTRVKAIVPIVIDLLNVESSFIHHHDVYGFWAPAIQDYVDMGITDWFGTAEFAALMELVDPYEYRDRLTLPKFMVNSAGDDFFLPDSSKFYFDDLLGPKYLRYVPNTDHSLGGTYANDSVISFYQAVLDDVNLPVFSWEIQEYNSIRVETDPSDARLMEVKLWQGTNPTARDFRKNNTNVVYNSSMLSDEGGGVYVGSVPIPGDPAWTAFFVELVYDSGDLARPYQFTTEVQIVSEPWADFDDDGDVDGSDFLMWQRGEVSNPPSAEDLADWQTYFGAVANSAAATSTTVPEPSSILLLFSALTCILQRRWLS
jgi:PhoPQ-activated pathogenicity-related protein